MAKRKRAHISHNKKVKEVGEGQQTSSGEDTASGLLAGGVETVNGQCTPAETVGGEVETITAEGTPTEMLRGSPQTSDRQGTPTDPLPGEQGTGSGQGNAAEPLSRGAGESSCRGAPGGSLRGKGEARANNGRRARGERMRGESEAGNCRCNEDTLHEEKGATISGKEESPGTPMAAEGVSDNPTDNTIQNIEEAEEEMEVVPHGLSSGSPEQQPPHKFRFPSLADAEEHLANLCQKYLLSYESEDGRSLEQDGVAAELPQSPEDPGRDSACRKRAPTNCKATEKKATPEKGRTLRSFLEAVQRSAVSPQDRSPSVVPAYEEEITALHLSALRLLNFVDGTKQVTSKAPGADKFAAFASPGDELNCMELMPLPSYNYAFKAVAVAEIIKLRSKLSDMKPGSELFEKVRVQKPCEKIPQNAEPVEKLKMISVDEESTAMELEALRTEKAASERVFAEIAKVLESLEVQLADCRCRNAY